MQQQQTFESQQKMKKDQEREDEILDGFSSEEEIRHQEIAVERGKETQVDEAHREEVRLKIPPPQEIKKKAYSLNPDIATGWAPKNDLPVPIPLIFDSRRTDNIVKRFMQKKNLKMKLVYLGPRYETTFYSWYNKPFNFPYTHMQIPHNIKFSQRAFCGQHWQAEEGLIFDSFFESGNLDCAIQVGPLQYDLYMRVDSNTRGHLQWFNFKITNVQKLQKYKINICNFQKKSSLYTKGQKPYIFSQKKFQNESKGWEQGGTSVTYQPKPGKSAKVLTTDYNCLYKLSFEFYTQYEKDSIQMAYCVPYLYSQLDQYLKKLSQGCLGQGFLTVSKLCNSLGGLEVPLITINEKSSSQDSDDARIPKKCIMVSGRVHPGETNGSYMMEGFLNFLCGDSKQAKRLRTGFIFKIAPMLNPDGVCMGNYRTGVSGKDFNRQYHHPDKSIFPEVHAFKHLVIETKAQFKENLFMFLDFHGHSTKKNVFMYGPEFPIIQKHYYQCRVFPKLLANHTSMFRYYSCSFRISECKITTARAILLKKLTVPLSYTIQASNGFYYDPQKQKDQLFTDEAWKNMGYKIGTSLAEYGELVMYSQRLKFQKLRQRRNKRSGSKKKPGNSNSSKEKRSANLKRDLSILSSEDQKIKNIFAEIKKIQGEREMHKNDEDAVSQGSSDGEGETDDLAQQKMKILYSAIKGKKGPEQINLRSSMHSNYEQDLIKSESTKIYSYDLHPSRTPELPPSRENDKEEHFKPNASLRGHLTSRNKKEMISYLSGSQKKQKLAARIINFSFFGGDRKTQYKSYSTKNEAICVANEGLTIPLVKKPKKDPFSFINTNNNNNCVLDLSNNGVCKPAYVSMLRQRIISKEHQGTVGLLGQNSRKTSMRLEEYRKKKSVIGNYHI